MQRGENMTLHPVVCEDEEAELTWLPWKFFPHT